MSDPHQSAHADVSESRLRPPGGGRVQVPAEVDGLLGSRHVGQHGNDCPGCVVCPTCKQRVDDHDLDAILACSAFHEAKKEARRG